MKKKNREPWPAPYGLQASFAAEGTDGFRGAGPVTLHNDVERSATDNSPQVRGRAVVFEDHNEKVFAPMTQVEWERVIEGETVRVTGATVPRLHSRQAPRRYHVDVRFVNP